MRLSDSDAGLPASRRTDAVLTVAEVAESLRCSKAHVYKAINGKVAGVSALPVISLGRRKLVRSCAFEQWKCANEQTAVGATIDPSLKIHAVDA
jgi:hypothetical protein